MGASTERLTRSIRWLQVYAALMTVALVASFMTGGTGTDGVLRARGLVIEDEAGRERILLGAPVPEAANRDEPFLGLTFWRGGEVVHDLNVEEGN